ncbi:MULTISPECIES: hypothetical protein [unclassified Dinoroseobacter]|uniref:hypothetical protein n=1 Tax=unclassified Dinoroseobacter TaxID=2620028 RepID=UPI00316926B4
MLIVAGLLGGAGWGAWLAKSRNGLKRDMAQYAAGFAIFWGLIGLIATIVLERMAA